MKVFKFLVTFSVFIFILNGCGANESTELSRYIAEVKARKAAAIVPIPKPLKVQTFIYPEQESRRSPFKQKKMLQETDAQAPNTNRPKEALEAFPLDALKFVGVIQEKNQVWALIATPKNSIVRVKVGNYIGQDFGKIIAIDGTSLKIEESVQVLGKWQKKITKFTLN